LSALKELMNYTFVSKYARWKQDDFRRETWHEAVDRVRGMMHTYYVSKPQEVHDKIDWAYDMMAKKKVLGSQRALQFGGEPGLKKHARVYNCTGSYCDRPRFFQECLWLLLCGCGTGFSVQKHHIDKLPPISSKRIFNVLEKREVKTYIIPDTIEGWSDALGILLTTYLDVPASPEFGEWVGYDVKFDYSLIRPMGSPLSSGVGKAPGPKGLRTALNKIRELLEAKVQGHNPYLGECKLRPIDCYDIVMHSSDAVLSGGVRRSATICVFSYDDEEMMQAKTGNWFAENPQRGRSNNSALLLRNKTTKEEFAKLMNCVKECGEPGFVWADDLEHMVNPCVEISFWCYHIENQKKFDKFMKTYDGSGIKGDVSEYGLVSGWQGCNLSTINCAAITSEDDFMEACKAASIIGTLQAGFTDFEYLTKASHKIFEREALLGVSMTGVMEKVEIVLDPIIQTKGAEVVKQENKVMATLLGINQAARATCLKPEGSSSCVLGTSSGIHPHHSKRYLRRVQANMNENPFKHFKGINPGACEISVWSANKTDEVVIFPIEVPDGAKTKNQLPALELLRIVKDTQLNWVMAGKNIELCTQPWLSHNVSNTITVLPEEWDSIEEYLYENRYFFCGVSLIPASGDKDYPQAPFTSVYTSREIVREYGEPALWTSGLIEVALEAFDGNLWKACDFALFEEQQQSVKTANKWVDGKDLNLLHDAYISAAAKLQFLAKMQKFADKYFEGNLKRLTHCMKDVYNWKLYCDLSKSFKKVDYTEMFEADDDTKPQEEIACAGGACAI
jgi:ribonucleoside-triphosphate reductase